MKTTITAVEIFKLTFIVFEPNNILYANNLIITLLNERKYAGGSTVADMKYEVDR